MQATGPVNGHVAGAVVQFDGTINTSPGRYLLKFKEPLVDGTVRALADVELGHLLEEGSGTFWAHFGEELDVVVAVESSHL